MKTSGAGVSGGHGGLERLVLLSCRYGFARKVQQFYDEGKSNETCTRTAHVHQSSRKSFKRTERWFYPVGMDAVTAQNNEVTSGCTGNKWMIYLFLSHLSVKTIRHTVQQCTYVTPVSFRPPFNAQESENFQILERISQIAPRLTGSFKSKSN